MREEVRQEKVVYRGVMVYIADDGTEFDNKIDCENYEWEKLNKPLLEKLHRCNDADDMPNVHGGFVSDYNSYEWYFIRSGEDIDILNKVYNAGLTGKEIGEWVCVEHDDMCDAWFTTASDGVEYAKELFTKLGYKVDITME